MREILFRGKTIDGDWTYGYYVFTPKRTGAFGQTIGSADFDRYYILTMKYNLVKEVIPETVGQYTGLNDKNGKKIFEGDVLKIAKLFDSTGTYYFPPLNYPVNVVVKWDMCAWMWETLCEDKRYIGFPEAWCHYKCELIGNIHDNPELLKEGGKG